MSIQDEIAIVGVGCRFPGADNLSEYWTLLKNGENHVKEIPKERWDVDAFYDEDPNKPGKTYVRKAGFINRFDEWDHRFFGTSEKEAELMDPQQRMVLECVHMAMEDGGITRKQLDGTHTGVYIGVMNNDYREHVTVDTNLNSTYMVTGTNISIISARVSYVYNLVGPAITLDTACSSSLVAVNLGSQALKLGECDTAICGGVNLLLDPSVFVVLAKARMLSRVGQCQTYSADADGYARSEGCGIVIIKRLEDAIRDGNTIWATMQTGANQDGHFATPITAPSGKQQIDLLERVYGQSGINRDTVQVIEAHGTGTPIGDPVEANALGTFFSYNKKKPRPIFIGSVKSNIGHLESAAGVAGLIKVLLMMKHETVVPSLMYEEANENPKVNLKEYGLLVPTECRPWPFLGQNVRTACVNSFGFGGTNAHAILKQFKHEHIETDLTLSKTTASPYFVVLSALDHDALKENVSQFSQDLQDNRDDLAALSFTSTCKRDHLPERKTFLVSSKHQLETSCQDFLNSTITERKLGSQKKLVFVCCGVGTVWNGMFKTLLENSSFADAVRAIDRILAPLAGWSIESKIQRNEDLLRNPVLAHIAIFTYQVGLAALWENAGIRPDCVIGQSVGEVAAAYIAGKIDLTSAVNIIYYRSKLLSEVTGGTMAVVSNIPTDEIEAYCKTVDESISIAVYNSSTSCTVSGTKEAVTNLTSQFKTKAADESKIKELNVACAYHSQHVEPVVSKLTTKLSKLKGCSSETEIISSVTGKKETGWCFSTGKYWGSNIRRPVQFSTAIKHAFAPSGTTVFLEIGPGPVLHTHTSDLFDEDQDYRVLVSAKFGQAIQTTRQTICKLFEYGYNILWSNIIEPTKLLTAIPKYQFLKKTTLYQNPTIKLRNQGIEAKTNSHLYMEMIDSSSKGPQFIARIDQSRTPFVYEHVVKGMILVPGAFHADVGFEVGKVVLDEPVEQTAVSLQFLRPIKIEKNGRLTLSVNSKRLENDTASFSIKQGQSVMCKGCVHRRSEDRIKTKPRTGILDLKQTMSAVNKLDQTALYKRLEEHGFQYGDSFRVLKDSASTEDSCLIEMEIPVSVLKGIQRTVLHPCVLDGLLQSAIAIFDIKLSEVMKEENITFLPVAVEAIKVHKQPVEKMYVYTVRTNRTMLPTVLKMHYDCTLMDLNGNVIATVTNLTLYCKRTAANTPDELKYKLTWEPLKTLQSPNEKRLLILSNALDKTSLNGLESDSTITCCRDSLSMEYQDYISNAFALCEAKWDPKAGVDGIVVLFESSKMEDIEDQESADRVFQSTVENCWLLVILARYLVDHDVRKPLIVVTQNTHSVSGAYAFGDIVGPEVWGFLRSVELEFVLDNVTIVDISPGLAETKRTLLNFIHGAIDNLDQTDTEIKIVYDNVYVSRISTTSTGEQTPYLRQVNQRKCCNYIMRSDIDGGIAGTHLVAACSDEEDRPYGKMRESRIFLRVKTVYVHPSDIFPLSPSTSHDLKDGNSVWGVEYTGYKRFQTNTNLFRCGASRINPDVDHLENEWERIAVFPVEMKSVVCVPVDCTVNMKDLYFYEYGLLFNSVVAWAITKLVPANSSVLIKSDYSNKTLDNVLSVMLAKRKKVKIVEANGRKVDVVVVLSPRDYQYAVLRKAKYIIALKHVIKDNDHNSLIMKDEVQVEEIDLTEVSSRNNISKVLSKIVRWLNKHFSHGKTVESNECNDAKVEVIEALALPYMVPLNKVFDKNDTYLITGGLTGLGWELLLLMVEMGAGTIATLSRRNASEEQATDIEQIERKFSCRIISIQADVTRLESVKTAIKSIQSYPGAGPIRGILHGAGVLGPALLLKLTKSHLDNVMKAKILGTLNLHIATKHLKLDYFILQSSITSIIGQPGQGNYGAANAFLDTFAQWRRSKGLPAQAINWGALEMGMAVQMDFAINFEKRGYHLLTMKEIRSCFQQAVMQNDTGVVYTDVDWHLVAKDYSSHLMARIRKKMKHVLEENDTTRLEVGNSDSLLVFDAELARNSDPDKRNEMLVSFVKAVAKGVLINNVETYTMTSTFAEIGVDSMSSVTVANVIYDASRCRIPPHFMLAPERTLTDVVKYLNGLLSEHNADEKIDK